MEQSCTTNHLVFYQESATFDILFESLGWDLQYLMQGGLSRNLKLLKGQVIWLRHFPNVVEVNFTINNSFIVRFLSFLSDHCQIKHTGVYL